MNTTADILGRTRYVIFGSLNRGHNVERVLTVVALGILSCSAVWAQSTAQIHGTIRDASGAGIPGAEVKATQSDTGVVRTVTSDAEGGYVLPALATGPYKIEVSKDGFSRAVESGIVLQVSSDPLVDIALKVGAVSEQVSVEANATQVETRSSGIGEVVQTQRIVDLPLNGRNVTDLVTLAGASVNNGNIRNSFFQNLPMINIAGAPMGAQPFGIEFSLDGANHKNFLTATTMPVAFPDAVQEFKVESSGQSASKGSMAAVSMVTRSGTNDLHGNLFEFIRNDGFGSAREYFSKTSSVLKRNQFGGVVGGPIKKNKLFYFAGYQATILRADPGNTIGAVPKLQMLQTGDWSTFASPACNGGAQKTLKAPFVNNQINPAQYSKAAVYIMQKFLPTIPVTPDQCGNITYGTPGPENDYQYVGKIDYQINDRQSVFFRLLDTQIKLPSPYTTTPDLLLVGNNGQDQLGQSYAIGHTFVVGPTLVQSVRLAAHRTAANDYTHNVSFDYCQAGVQNFWCDAPGELGSATITNGFPLGGTAHQHNYWTVNFFALDDDVNWVKGNHQMTFGGGTSWGAARQLNHFASVGTFAFNGQITGSGLSDFMAGLPSTLLQGLPNTVFTREGFVNLYFTDSWKITPRLTFNFGIRWEPYLPLAAGNGQISTFDLNAFKAGTHSTVFPNAPAGFTFPGDNGFIGLSATNKQVWNFAPRGGLAWDPKGDGKTSIRAAYAFGYAYVPAVTRQDQAGSNPWGGRSTYSTTGVATFDNPYPNGNPYPYVINQNVKFTPQGQFITNPPDLPSANTYSWNVAVQRQFGRDWIASVTYIGSRVLHLYVNLPINEGVVVGPPSSTCAATAAPSVCSGTSNLQARRVLSLINPAQGALVGNMDTWDASGFSHYNGLLSSIQKRVSKGVTVNANWTWSHCISVQQGYDSKSDVTSTNPYNPLFDRGNCDADRRHITNITAVYQLPRVDFGNKIVKQAISDWQISGIYQFRSGQPLTVRNGTDRALTGVNQQRADVILPDSVYTGNSGPNAIYLNPKAFQPAPLGQLGNLGWNNLVSPTYWTLNLALSRRFAITERQGIELRADAFNVTNSFVSSITGAGIATSAAVPVFMNLNAAQFGLNNAAQPTRKIQFALKYSF
jgi:Carboxypeptidase regulatory-like domain